MLRFGSYMCQKILHICIIADEIDYRARIPESSYCFLCVNQKRTALSNSKQTSMTT